MAALDIVADEPERRRDLLARAEACGGSWPRKAGTSAARPARSFPLVMGEPHRAVELSARLWSAGCCVPAIRPPTVPEGEACLRISLSYGHTAEMIARLVGEMVDGGHG